VTDADAFWGEQADEFLSWFSKWDKVQDGDYNVENA
jgi:acetyl-CoA synthetase